MRNPLCFAFLFAVKCVSRVFYRPEVTWVGEKPEKWWEDVHLVALLNHTTLFEPVFLAGVERGFLRRVAEHGVVPIADKTTNRPLIGPLFKLFAPDVVPITRRRDHTWDGLQQVIDDESLVIVLPEGRMLRADGLDSQGKPLTVRGGIADLMRVIPDGHLLFAYSGGLHHVQIPGQGFPRVFRTIRLRFERVPLGEYREALGMSTLEPRDFKRAVIEDMTRRRDLHCPVAPGTTSIPDPEALAALAEAEASGSAPPPAEVEAKLP